MCKLVIKKDIFINDYKQGSVEYQIICLTKKLYKLQNHLRIHKHDFHNKNSLLKLISKRKQYLEYLKRHKKIIYHHLITKLKLRK